MAEPLSPHDMNKPETLQRKFPDFVIEAFDQLIIENWNGHSARFSQTKVVAKLVSLGNISRKLIFERKLLDVEPLYRAKGWKVNYDSPGYNESYEPSFTFSR